MDTNKNLIKESLLKEIEKRFEDQLTESIQQLRGRVEENFRFHQQNIVGLKRYKTVRNVKSNLDKMKIAETFLTSKPAFEALDREPELSLNAIHISFTPLSLKFRACACPWLP